MTQEEKIKKIQTIDIFGSKDWNSGMYPHMTNKQLIDCAHYLFSELMRSVRTLRGEVNILDVGCNALCHLLLEELDKRLGVKRE